MEHYAGSDGVEVICITVPGADYVRCDRCEEESLEKLAELAADTEPEQISGSQPLTDEEARREHSRKQAELLRWAGSLTAEQINALCDFGYYNGTIKGYLIRAAREAELPEEKISELLRCMSYALDVMDKADADRLYSER